MLAVFLIITLEELLTTNYYVGRNTVNTRSLAQQSYLKATYTDNDTHSATTPKEIEVPPCRTVNTKALAVDSDNDVVGKENTTAAPEPKPVTVVVEIPAEKSACHPYSQVMTAYQSGGLGNLMSEYASLFALSAIAGFNAALQQVSQSSKSTHSRKCCTRICYNYNFTCTEG